MFKGGLEGASKGDFRVDFKQDKEGDLLTSSGYVRSKIQEVDLEGELVGDFKGDFKHDMEGDLLSSSCQVRSRSARSARSFSQELACSFSHELGRL